MKKAFLWGVGGLMLAAGIGLTIYRLLPTQQEQIAAIRQRSNRFLVVTREMFVPALAPWTARRQSQGFDVVVQAWPTPPTSGQINQWIESQGCDSKDGCRFIMLVGDCAAQAETGAPWHLPSIISGMGYPYEGNAYPIVGDAPYGDIDRDGRAEIAVGRLPVRSVDQLEMQLAKIVAHETQLPTPDYYRAVLWTGGKYFHRPMHQITLQFLEFRMPRWLYPHLLSSFSPSVCSGPLLEQPAHLLATFSHPAFMTLVVSHGSHNNLRCGEIEGLEVPLPVKTVMAGIDADIPSGPLIMLACEAGTFDLPTEQGPCMAEAFLDQPGGPVAVIGASGPINAATNLFMALSISDNINGSSDTIGDLLLDSRQFIYEVGKYSLAQIAKHDRRTRQLLSSASNSEQEIYHLKGLLRNERLHYNLLGDPSIRLNRPLPLSVTIDAVGDSSVTVSGSTPPGAQTLWVQLVDLNRLGTSLPLDADDNMRRQSFQEANRPPELLVRHPLSGARWQVDIPLEKPHYGAGYRIRLMATGQERVYAHAISLPVSTKPAGK